MCICIYVHICVCICMNVYVYMYTCMYIYTLYEYVYIHMYTCMYLFRRMYKYMYTYIDMSEFEHIYITHTYTCVHIYIYTLTHRLYPGGWRPFLFSTVSSTVLLATTRVTAITAAGSLFWCFQHAALCWHGCSTVARPHTNCLSLTLKAGTKP